MDDKKEIKPVTEVKGIKETKDSKETKATLKVNQKEEMELIIAYLIIDYAQVSIHTLQHSGTEITPKAIREEIKMFYNKFGNEDIKRLANTIVKEKKEKK